MAVKIRMKMMGRRHRPFFRICVTDVRTPRDGRVLEEVGYYDPMVPETDARAVLNCERINYWVGVGAKPSDRVAVLIKKYGTDGTHLEAQKAAVERLKKIRRQPAPQPVSTKPAKKTFAVSEPDSDTDSNSDIL
ncbi:MAG: 30S ribosomal protein S16 [Planctomycetaceae bacterium]|jgi:small subunit ribosomal protein S16|nr:30S ribosomal protein S16 [Planctomycetaceae bacterium]